MAFIATGSTTVGEVIDGSAEFILNGLYREKNLGRQTRQKEVDQRNAERRAIQNFVNHLNEMYCGDADTLLKDVPVPTGSPKVVQA